MTPHFVGPTRSENQSVADQPQSNGGARRYLWTMRSENLPKQSEMDVNPTRTLKAVEEVLSVSLRVLQQSAGERLCT